MAIILALDSQANSGGGSDVTPAAINWANITQTNTAGYEVSEAKSVTAIDTTIAFRATWTGSAYGQWIKNGVAVESVHASPAVVNISVNDSLKFAVYNGYAFPSGQYDTGTVTVTNDSDSGAAIDTFTYVVQFVYTGGGSTDPGDLIPGGGQEAN